MLQICGYIVVRTVYANELPSINLIIYTFYNHIYIMMLNDAPQFRVLTIYLIFPQYINYNVVTADICICIVLVHHKSYSPHNPLFAWGSIDTFSPQCAVNSCIILWLTRLSVNAIFCSFNQTLGTIASKPGPRPCTT